MPITPRATLKSYFETGDTPNQAQFAALVDTMFDLTQSLTDAAEAAAAVAADSIPKCLGRIKYQRGGGGAGSIAAVLKDFGCTITLGATSLVSTSGTNETNDVELIITPDTDFADAEFVVLFSTSSSPQLAAQPLQYLRLTRAVDELRAKIRCGTKYDLAFPTDYCFIEFAIWDKV